MVYKIYKRGNYIVIVDTANNYIEEASGNVLITKSKTDSTAYNINLKSSESLLNIAFADLRDESNTAYSSQDIFENWYSSSTGFSTATGGSVANIVYFIASKSDFPTAVSGVITLQDNSTYYVTTTVDLLGDRIVSGQNSVILGFSSENCYLKSTGLNSETALITSNYSLPIRNISFTHGTVFNLDGDGVTTALDWFGINFVNCATVGTIKDYSNFVLGDSAFLNSSGMTFDGTIGTIAFGNCLFDCSTGGTAIILPSTLTVSRRFRIIYSSFVTLSSESSINVSTSATIGNERYILDTVNFSGGGSYILGVDQTSNKTLFTNCVGIQNTTTRGFYYMVNNATDTPIGVPNVNVWVKALGTTTADSNNSKFTHSNNRLTYTGAFNTSFLVTVNTAVRSGASNQNISIGIAKNGSILTNSEMTIRTSTSNQEHPGSTQYQIDLVSNDYLELFVKNNQSTDVRVSDLNFSVVKILV